MVESFWWHRQGRSFWENLAGVLVVTTIYLATDPVGGHNGGTVFGYAVGTICAFGIGYLMWYGMRKRSYNSASNTLKECLAAHVWLGVALSILVPIHAGFQLGLNVHTLAYLLMMIVIISGIYGAVNYSRLAPLIAAHRGGGHAPALLEQINRLGAEISHLCHGKSDEVLHLAKVADFTFVPGLWSVLTGKMVSGLDAAQVALRLAKVPAAEHADAVKLVSVATRRREVALRLQTDLRNLSLLRVWLWVHLPFSFALLLAVVAHIVLVLLYR